MHKVRLSAAVEARLLDRGEGRLFRFERIDARRTAHIVIDLQNGFLAPGALLEIPEARDIIPNVNTISATVRENGALNVFIRFATSFTDVREWSTFYETFPNGAGAAHREAFAPGAMPWRLWPALDVVEPIDTIVDKRRFSAFVPGTCDLDGILRTRGIDTLIVTGTLTNCCCEATARDAMQRNYRVIVASDATAAMSDAEHNASLDSMRDVFADVRSTADIITLLEGGSV